MDIGMGRAGAISSHDRRECGRRRGGGRGGRGGAHCTGMRPGAGGQTGSRGPGSWRDARAVKLSRVGSEGRAVMEPGEWRLEIAAKCC